MSDSYLREYHILHVYNYEGCTMHYFTMRVHSIHERVSRFFHSIKKMTMIILHSLQILANSRLMLCNILSLHICKDSIDLLTCALNGRLVTDFVGSPARLNFRKLDFPHLLNAILFSMSNLQYTYDFFIVIFLK